MAIRVKGYTLIEIMITIAVIAVIALVTVPITGKWVQDADVSRTEGQILEAVGRIKASGIRNVSGAMGDDHVAIACISTLSDHLKVMESTSSVAADCTLSNTATKLWEDTLDSDVTITDINDVAVTCLCTNNKGMLTQPATGICSSCFNGTTLKISSGSQFQNIQIF